MPALFPDHNSYYELLGAHSQIANECITCHNGNYNSIPNSCYGCHQTDYNNTTNPNHQASGFNTDCETCHTQNAWQPAAFDHDNQFFPIYSGTHREEWNSCSDCHTYPSNFSVFSCTDCHEHNKAETDDDHSEVRGYVYESTQCLSCHPKGDDINIRNSNIRPR